MFFFFCLCTSNYQKLISLLCPSKIHLGWSAFLTGSFPPPVLHLRLRHHYQHHFLLFLFFFFFFFLFLCSYFNLKFPFWTFLSFLTNFGTFRSFSFVPAVFIIFDLVWQKCYCRQRRFLGKRRSNISIYTTMLAVITETLVLFTSH